MSESFLDKLAGAARSLGYSSAPAVCLGGLVYFRSTGRAAAVQFLLERLRRFRSTLGF